MTDNIDQPRFDELRQRQRRGHAQDPSVGAENRALWHRVHVATETGGAETVDQIGPEAPVLLSHSISAGKN